MVASQARCASIIPTKRTGAGMAGHRRLEFLESARWLRKLRNQCGFRGSQLLISGDFSRDRLWRIQAQDRNLVSPAPIENALVSGRCLPPAAFKRGASRERGPTDLLFEVLIQCALLRDIDHFHPDSHRVIALMERANDFLLELVMRGLVVLFGDVNDASAQRLDSPRRSERPRRGRRIVRRAAGQD